MAIPSASRAMQRAKSRRDTASRRLRGLPPTTQVKQRRSSSAGRNATARSPPEASTSAAEPRTRTVAEMSREKKLRDDPLAEVVSPLFVDCRRCLSRIKLSPKSSFDLFHWQKHRERCLKRSAAIIKGMRQDAGEQVSPSPPSTPSSVKQSPKRLIAESLTPPLTPDEDEDEVGDEDKDENDASPASPHMIKEESSSPTPSLSANVSAKQHHPAALLSSLSVFHGPDLIAFEGYLHRSRRRSSRAHSPLLSLTPESWQEWSWGQLKAAVWVLKEYPSESKRLEDGDGGDDAMDVDADVEVDVSADKDEDMGADLHLEYPEPEDAPSPVIKVEGDADEA